MAKNFKEVLEDLQKNFLKTEGVKEQKPEAKKPPSPKKKESLFKRFEDEFTRRKEGAKKKYTDTKEGAKKKYKDTKESVKKKYRNTKEGVKKKYKDTKESVKKKYTETKEKASKGLTKLLHHLRSGNLGFFVYFCFVSLMIFTFTLITVHDNQRIYHANVTKMKDIQGFYTFGVVILSIFLMALAWSYGEDKRLLLKIASFILMAGCIYMGTFFTYLEGEGRYVNLTSGEQMMVVFAVFFFVVFLLASSAYVLFEEKGEGHKKIWEFFSVLYSLCAFIGFFAVGGAVANTFANITIPPGEKESLLLPFCIGLFAGGCVLFVLGVMDSIKSIRNAANKGMGGILKLIRQPRFAAIIFLSFAMSIYYAIAFYESYNSGYIQRKIKDGKSNKLISLMETLYYAGFGVIGLFLLILAMSFGGDAEQIMVGLFLVAYIFFVGSLTTYLDVEGKISVSGDEEGMVTGTVVVFCILILVCLLYVLFVNKRTKQVLILDVLQLGAVFGSMVLYQVMFGICTGVAFQNYAFNSETSSQSGVLLWSGFGIGLFIDLVILGIIISFFLAP